jgi:hypothetical protein
VPVVGGLLGHREDAIADIGGDIEVALQFLGSG